MLHTPSRQQASQSITGGGKLSERVVNVSFLPGWFAMRTVTTLRIEFAPENLRNGPVRHMMCAIPGGVRVEFIATAS